MEDLDLLKKEILADLHRELVINSLTNVAKEEQQVTNKIILETTKKTYNEALKNLYEDLSDSVIENLVKDFNIEIQKVFNNYMSN
jgi:hypothetical protein